MLTVSFWNYLLYFLDLVAGGAELAIAVCKVDLQHVGGSRIGRHIYLPGVHTRFYIVAAYQQYFTRHIDQADTERSFLRGIERVVNGAAGGVGEHRQELHDAVVFYIGCAQPGLQQALGNHQR